MAQCPSLMSQLHWVREVFGMNGKRDGFTAQLGHVQHGLWGEKIHKLKMQITETIYTIFHLQMEQKNYLAQSEVEN